VIYNKTYQTILLSQWIRGEKSELKIILTSFPHEFWAFGEKVCLDVVSLNTESLIFFIYFIDRVSLCDTIT
jgi:hypothetical protein